MSAHHVVKATSDYFQAVWDGRKTFEVRYDDRGYQAGDTIVMREYDPGRDCSRCSDGRHRAPDCGRYTGRTVTADIGYVLASTPARGQQPGFWGRGYVVLALLNTDRAEDVSFAATHAPGPTTAQSFAAIARASR